MPEWLEKWAALIMEYVETEQALLPQELLALRPPYATYTPASAAAEAKGEIFLLLFAMMCHARLSSGAHTLSLHASMLARNRHQYLPPSLCCY